MPPKVIYCHNNKKTYLARELKKTVEHEGDSDSNSSWCA